MNERNRATRVVWRNAAGKAFSRGAPIEPRRLCEVDEASFKKTSTWPTMLDSPN
jgi:hypothetical protein